VPTTTALDAQGFPAFKLILLPAASYPTQLQTLLRNRYITQQTGIVITNAGLPGEAAQDAPVRFSGVLASVAPEVLLLLHGANDLALDGAVGVTRAANGVERMAREARNRGARVFIASLPPPRPGGRNTLPAELVTSLNSRLRIIATGEAAVFVDLYQALVSNIPTFVGTDGLHLTEVGYQRVAETFSTAIQSALEVR
jgi:lysophospholipase L1-like esterase